MIVSPLAAIHIALVAAAVGLAITATESLWHLAKGNYARDGLWPWHILKEAHSPAAAAALGPLMDSEGVLALTVMRLVCALAAMGCIAAGLTPLAPLAVLIAIQFIFQLRMRYGGEGADQMTTLVMIAAAIAELGRPYPGVVAAAALFIGGQITLSYLASGTAKLFGESWRKATALPRIMNHYTYGSPLLRGFLVRNPLAARLLGLGVIAFQLTFWVFYLLPMPWALVYLAGGLAFHAAIALFMRLNLFLITFIGTYPCLLFTHAVVRSWLGL